MGRYLVAIPVFFDTYLNWSYGNLSQLVYPFGLQDALGNIVGPLLGWLIGLFMFGVLLPYIKGTRTPIKGVVFGLVASVAFAAEAAIRHTLAVAPYPTFIIDGLLAIGLFATVGLLLDIDTLRKHNNEDLINSIYRLGSIRVAVTYATTLIIVAIAIWQTFYLASPTAQQRSQKH